MARRAQSSPTHPGRDGHVPASPRARRRARHARRADVGARFDRGARDRAVRACGGRADSAFQCEAAMVARRGALPKPGPPPWRQVDARRPLTGPRLRLERLHEERGDLRIADAAQRDERARIGMRPVGATNAGRAHARSVATMWVKAFRPEATSRGSAEARRRRGRCWAQRRPPGCSRRRRTGQIAGLVSASLDRRTADSAAKSSQQGSQGVRGRAHDSPPAINARGEHRATRIPIVCTVQR